MKLDEAISNNELNKAKIYIEKLKPVIDESNDSSLKIEFNIKSSNIEFRKNNLVSAIYLAKSAIFLLNKTNVYDIITKRYLLMFCEITLRDSGVKLDKELIFDREEYISVDRRITNMFPITLTP